MNAKRPLRPDHRPLYVQACEAYRALLLDGDYAPGDRLPSEIELSQQWGISRPTLREALRLLEEEGAIIRRHGVGTFVAPADPVIDAGLEVLESIERMDARRGLATRMIQYSVEERSATEREARGLELPASAPVTVVSRVIEAGERRVAYLTDVVPAASLRPADLDERFSGSVLDLFLERGWPLLSHSRTELVAEAADARLARLLQVERRSPLLRLQGQLYAVGGEVVDFSTSQFVKDLWRFHVIRKIGQSRS
jgi:GntR family transcriptional regulator